MASTPRNFSECRVSVSTIYSNNGTNGQKKSEVQNEVRNQKVADFETAIAATGTGKFHYLLLLAIIPAIWASSFDTTNISLILPSAECDLQLTLFHKGVLNAVTYVGMVLSGFLWGFVADVKGRKSLLVYGYLADGICNVLAGFSQNFWTLVFFKFLSGFLVSGPYATSMTYGGEFYRTKDRSRILLLLGFFCTAGGIVNAALGWWVIPRDWSLVLWDGAFVYNSWRIFLSLCGVPTLFGAFCLSFFPESPKFLMSQGRNEEAMAVFRKMYAMNTGRPAETFPISALKDERDEAIDSTTTTSERPAEIKPQTFRDGVLQIKPIFLNPHLPRLILVLTIQFCGLSAVNTFRLWQPQLFAILNNFGQQDQDILQTAPTFCEIVDFSTREKANHTAYIDTSEIIPCTQAIVEDSVYYQTIIVSTSSIAAILIASAFVNLLGHKKLLLISYGISLLCLVSLIWSANALLTLTLTCLFVGLMMTSINVVTTAACVLFPTTLRTMAVSMGMITGRFGSMIGNLLFPVLLTFGCLAPLALLSSLTLMCIFITFCIPKPSDDIK